MNTLYWLITITDRHSTDAFLALYEEHGITVSLRTVGAGTAVRETLSTLGLEQTEKAVLFAMITAETWPGLQKDLRRKMRIDVPGTGIAFIIPVSSIGGKRALQFLTEHQTFALKEESTLKDTRYELLLVIANQGHTGSIMDAARAAGAGGGTVIHAKGTGMEGAAHFMGVDLVNEKELVLIVSRTTLKNQIMQAIMQGAGPMSLPTVAPVPAPTLPCSSLVGVWSSASRTAAMPASTSGRTVGLPKARSKIQLEHTIGTCVGPTGRPMPRLSSSRATPLAASRPKADPPERQTAWTLSTVFSGRSRAVSRDAGAPPRTSTPPVAPSGATITVQPVPASSSV